MMKSKSKLKKQSNKGCPLSDVNEMDIKPSLLNLPEAMTSEMKEDMNSETSATDAEDIPLIDGKSNVGAVAHASASRSLPTARSRLKSSLSDEKDYDIGPNSDIRTRSQSLSSEDNNIWKQREERPVLFLGSDMK